MFTSRLFWHYVEWPLSCSSCLWSIPSSIMWDTMTTLKACGTTLIYHRSFSTQQVSSSNNGSQMTTTGPCWSRTWWSLYAYSSPWSNYFSTSNIMKSSASSSKCLLKSLQICIPSWRSLCSMYMFSAWLTLSWMRDKKMKVKDCQQLSRCFWWSSSTPLEVSQASTYPPGTKNMAVMYTLNLQP